MPNKRANYQESWDLPGCVGRTQSGVAKRQNEPAIPKMLWSETVTSNPWASAGAFERPLKYQLGWKVFLETEGTATWKKRFFLKESDWGKRAQNQQREKRPRLKRTDKIGICLAPPDTDYSTVTSGLFCETRNMRLQEGGRIP